MSAVDILYKRATNAPTLEDLYELQRELSESGAPGDDQAAIGEMVMLRISALIGESIGHKRTEKHLAGKHDQLTHAGGGSAVRDRATIEAEHAEAKKAVYTAMAQAKATGSYAGISGLRQKVKALDAELAAASSGQKVSAETAAIAAEPIAASRSRKTDLERYDPGDVYGQYSEGVTNTTATGYGPKFITQSNEFFDRVIQAKEITKLVGAPTGSDVYIEFDHKEDEIRVTVNHPMFMEESRHTIRRENGETVMENNSVYIEDDAPAGFGTAMIAHQVAQARRMNVDKIKLTALRSSWETGYYAWPRIGFDGPLPSHVKSKLPASLGKSRRVSDLMKTRAGRDWWKENGDTVDLDFGTWATSQNSSILDMYVKEKTDTTKTTKEAITGGELLQFTADDDAILDDIWDFIGDAELGVGE